VNQVVDSKKVYSDIRTLYCVRTSDKSIYIPKSQLIAVYDLDGDNKKRVGFPTNPLYGNMFFDPHREMAFFSYYLAFDSLENVPEEYCTIDELKIDNETLVVRDTKTIIREEQKKMN